MDSIKILVVDDESRMRKLVKDFLSKKGYIVLEAGDGEEAVDIFMNNKDIGLIILDVMMPKMDGWETCKEIRKFSQVPIIMLTAKSDERDELLGFELGIDEYITKPFSPKILVARVEAILRRTSDVPADSVISALSREKILNNVWNYDYFGDARTIDTHVKKLRSKLKDKGDYIKTIWGMGYKFEVDDEKKVDKE